MGLYLSSWEMHTGWVSLETPLNNVDIELYGSLDGAFRAEPMNVAYIKTYYMGFLSPYALRIALNISIIYPLTLP